MPDPEERLALARALDLVSAVRTSHVAAWSDFLDPAKASVLYNRLVKERDVCIAMFGGFALAERKMLGVCPDYDEIRDEDFPIDVLDVTYDARFSRALVHRDFLGSILGLGIDRSRVGDIVIQDNVAHVFVCREIAGYVLGSLERVGRVKVTVSPGAAPDLPASAGSELRLTLASLRLDVIVSAVFRLSRGKSAELIAGEKVFVNWLMQKSVSAQAGEGDMITVRGLGRVKLLAVDGRTKKDRLVVRVMKY